MATLDHRRLDDSDDSRDERWPLWGAALFWLTSSVVSWMVLIASARALFG